MSAPAFPKPAKVNFQIRLDPFIHEAIVRHAGILRRSREGLMRDILQAWVAKRTNWDDPRFGWEPAWPEITLPTEPYEGYMELLLWQMP